MRASQRFRCFNGWSDTWSSGPLRLLPALVLLWKVKIVEPDPLPDDDGLREN